MIRYYIFFEYPWWLLLLIPLLALSWFLWKQRDKVSRIKMSSSQIMPEIRTLRIRLMWIPKALLLLSMAFLIISMAKPNSTHEEEIIEAEAVDIILALDLSASMLARDFNPNRLEVSKELAIQFVGKRVHDRIGLVYFAGESYTKCPLTNDLKLLSQYISEADIGGIEGGTAIGMGLATAVNRFRSSEAASKIVILLTDGVNNTGAIEPMVAADMAKAIGVKVYSIGVGSEGYAEEPVAQLPNGEYIYQKSMVQIDEALLKKISSMTDGKYYRATDESSLAKIYFEIDQLEKTKVNIMKVPRQKEAHRPLILLAMCCFILALILEHTYFKSFP
jgi:Ca-activated chloride channel homolog